MSRRKSYTGAGLIRSEGAATRKRIEAACRSDRQRLTADARARREALRDALRAERLALRGSCATKLSDARAATDAAIEEARKTAMQLQRLKQAARTPAQQHAAERARVRRAYQIQESDNAVEANLSPELLPAWRARKARTKGSKAMSRTEAFLQWVHDHPAEATRYYLEDIDRRIASMPEQTEAEYLEEQAQQRKRLRGRGLRQGSMRGLDPLDVTDDSDIPF